MAAAGSSDSTSNVSPIRAAISAALAGPEARTSRIWGAGGARKWVRPERAVVEEGEALELDRAHRLGRVGGVAGRGHCGRSAGQRGICSEA